MFGGELPPTPNDAFAALNGTLSAGPGDPAYDASFGALTAAWYAATGIAARLNTPTVSAVGAAGGDGVASERSVAQRAAWNKRFGGAMGAAAGCALLVLLVVVAVSYARRSRPPAEVPPWKSAAAAPLAALPAAPAAHISA